jgi:hypothetical protein
VKNKYLISQVFVLSSRDASLKKNVAFFSNYFNSSFSHPTDAPGDSAKIRSPVILLSRILTGRPGGPASLPPAKAVTDSLERISRNSLEEIIFQIPG